MALKEAAIYLQSAEDQLNEASLALEHGRNALSVFLSAMSGENATSALILALGHKPSKKHRNSIVLYKLAQTSPELKPRLVELVDVMKKLEPHITKARYPIRKGPELLPPSKYYDQRIAQEIFQFARKGVAAVKEVLSTVKP